MEKRNALSRTLCFECGTGGGYTFVSNSNMKENESHSYTSKILASVALDADWLCKPKVKVDFSSIIHFVPRNTQGQCQLEFDLVRLCKDSPDCVIGTWNYGIEKGDESLTKSFCFNLCDYGAGLGNCTYQVKCRPVLLKDAVLCVTNCQMVALAQEHQEQDDR